MANDDEILSLLRDLNKKHDKLSDSVGDIRVSQARQETAFDAHMKQDEQMAKDLEKYNAQNCENTAQLKIHIAGVNELKDISQKQDKRITKLEEPRQFLHTAIKYVMDISKILVALAIIWYVIHMWPHIDLSKILL